MTKEVTLEEVRSTINHLVQGVDPYSGEALGPITFLENPRMIRCFAMMSDLLTKSIERPSKAKRRGKFAISDAVAQNIQFPKGDIGVQRLLDSVNQAIDPETTKTLTVPVLYKQLKSMEILANAPEGAYVKTIVGPKASEYGIASVAYTYQGETYKRIMYTEKGKAFIRTKLSDWFPIPE